MVLLVMPLWKLPAPSMVPSAFMFFDRDDLLFFAHLLT